jgi:hypothetical protein
VVVKVKIIVLWHVTPCSFVGRYNDVHDKPVASPFYIEDGGSRFLRNIFTYLPKQPVSLPRQPQSFVVILEVNGK